MKETQTPAPTNTGAFVPAQEQGKEEGGKLPPPSRKPRASLARPGLEVSTPASTSDGEPEPVDLPVEKSDEARRTNPQSPNSDGGESEVGRSDGADDKLRTRRTGNRVEREDAEQNLLIRWKSDAISEIQYQLGESLQGFQSLDNKLPSEVVDIYINAGRQLGYAMDDKHSCVELDSDLAHVYSPRTSLLAHAARDLIAKSINRPVLSITLKATLQLNEGTSKATPTWLLRFDRCGIDVNSLQKIERRIHGFTGLVGSQTDALWRQPGSHLLPDEPTDVAAYMIDSAKEIRTAVGGKPIASDCEIASTDFQASIKVPAKVGAKPVVEPDDKVSKMECELSGYDRSARLVFAVPEGCLNSIALSANMEIFGPLVFEEAAIAGNKCHIWSKDKQPSDKKSRSKLRLLQVRSNGLFAKLPDVDASNLSDEQDAAQDGDPAPTSIDEKECSTVQSTSNS